MSADTCKYCGCQEFSPCEGGCAWADENKNLCTVCAHAAQLAGELVVILGAVAANPRLGIRLATAKWEALTLEQQRQLVMTMRATVDGIRSAIFDAIADDQITAAVELNVITEFLLEKCPDQVGDEDSVSDVVMRLIEPHIGSRVVIPGGVTV